MHRQIDGERELNERERERESNRWMDKQTVHDSFFTLGHKLSVKRLNPFQHLLENMDYRIDDSITEDMLEQMKLSNFVDERIIDQSYKFYEV